MSDEFRQALEEVKLRSPIEEVVRERVPALRRQGRLWVACCPFHEEKTPSFKVDPAKGYWHCYGACGEGGDQIDFVRRYDNVEFLEAVELLAARSGVALPERRAPRRPKESDHADGCREVLSLAEAFFAKRLRGAEGAAALDYLRGRGFVDETLEAFGLGWAPAGPAALIEGLRRTEGPRPGAVDPERLIEAGLCRRSERGSLYDFFRGRLMIPIRDLSGRTVGFGARKLSGDDPTSPKYVNSPETPVFHKGQLIYGLDRARDTVRRSGHLVLVEGYTDVMAAHQVGLSGTAAILGTSTTDEHAALVRRAGARRVTLVFDGDEAGRKATFRALSGLLPLELELDVFTPPEGQDPCDLCLRQGADGLRAELERARPWLAYLLESLRGMPAARLSLGVDRLLELIFRLRKPVHRDACLVEVADFLGHPLESVREQLESLPERRRERAQAERERAAAPAPEAPDAGAERVSRRAYEELVGAVLRSPDLLPRIRSHADACPWPDLGRILAALLELDELGEAPIGVDSLMTLLGEDPARELVVRAFEHATRAEDPQILLEGADRFLNEREALEGVRRERLRLDALEEDDEQRRAMREIHARLRRIHIPGTAN